MTKVTYLFGAGASANALPVVKDLPNRIKTLRGQIEKLPLPGNESFVQSNKPKKWFHNNLIADLNWLYDNLHDYLEKENSEVVQKVKHASVDTFAKKLFLIGEQKSMELTRLKIALSMFFMLEQTRFPADMRYDTFFASILTKDVFTFPEHIRILSWNYDYQFEKAFASYCEKHELSKIQKYLNIVSKGSLEGFPNGFGIVKLNGTTFFRNKEGKPIHGLENITVVMEDTNTIDFLTNYYAVFLKEEDYIPGLSFAWEGEGTKGETIIDKAIACTKDTEVLVVIGYSLPFFNRDVDRKIIGEMTNLRKVYFQAPAPYHEKTRTRFQAIRQDIAPENLIAYDEIESFLLPDELEL